MAESSDQASSQGVVCEQLLRKALASKALFIEIKSDVYPADEKLFGVFASILTTSCRVFAFPTTGWAHDSPLR